MCARCQPIVRRRSARSQQSLLELEAAQPGEPDVEHEAAGSAGHARVEEGLGAREGLDLEPDGADQAAQPRADGLVVVHDEDDVGPTAHAGTSIAN